MSQFSKNLPPPPIIADILTGTGEIARYSSAWKNLQMALEETESEVKAYGLKQNGKLTTKVGICLETDHLEDKWNDKDFILLLDSMT